MLPAMFLVEARDDIDDAYANYETQSPGLGRRFLRSLYRTIGLIENNPWLYGEVTAGVRAGLLRRFPFVVYFRVEQARLVVLAVRHARDNPAVWQDRA